MAFPSFVLCTVALLVATSSAAPRSNKVSLKIPDECKNKNGFCSIKPEGYDEIEEKINKLLPPFLIDLVDRDSLSPDTPVVTESDEDNCPSEMTTRRFYTYQDENQTKVDIIVNTKLFPQTVQTITCRNDEIERNSLWGNGAQCFRKLGLSSDWQLSCQESTATRRLLVFDPDRHTFSRKNYTISVCCSCQIRSNF